ncbi:MAG: ATP-binding protein [Deltaproteobacteria bacterium]
MDARETIRLLDLLADVRERRAASEALAKHFAATALFVFVPDPDRATKLIPAPGFPTVPSVRGWRELLAACGRPGVELGRVAYPDGRSDAAACAYAFDGLVVVLVGATAPDAAIGAQLAMVARVLAAMFRAEAGILTARGELEVERRNAERIASLARALDRARGDAERATRVKNDFLAMLGHELRNPLAPIVTALQMMRMQGINTRAQDVLERQVAHVLRLVDDLLDISRITSGKVELRRERVEISAVVARALEMSRPLLEQRRNVLTVDVAERGLVVDGDPARLAQVFSNLLTNAAKYSDLGTAIELRAHRVGDLVRVSVVDHGIGIDAPFIERVFDQFVQVPQGIDRAAGGLGLGLAIVKSLVQRHHGSVRVASDGAGCGTTFVVELPLCRAPEVHEAAKRVEAQLPRPASSARVLVVDDNTDAASLLADVLTAYGHDVQVAHSGPDALLGLASFTPDAALLDIGLPVMDGYELARALHARLPGLKLVALTGYGQPDDRARSSAAGFDAHLVKPVSIANLTRTLEDLLA